MSDQTTASNPIWIEAKKRMLMPLRLATGAFVSFCMWQFNTLTSMASDEAIRLVHFPDPETARWIAGWVAEVCWWIMLVQACFAVLAVPDAIRVLAWPKDFVRVEKAKEHANTR